MIKIDKPQEQWVLMDLVDAAREALETELDRTREIENGLRNYQLSMEHLGLKTDVSPHLFDIRFSKAFLKDIVDFLRLAENFRDE